MKIKPSHREAASALLITLFMITLLAISIAGYLTYVEQQALLGARAQSWNLALGVSEAGVEEALQHLNSNPANLNADGWSADGNTYSVTRALADGNSYTVWIDATSASNPVITSQSSVAPATFARLAPTYYFAAAGVNTPTARPPVTRKVRVTTSRGNLFLAAMVAKHRIDLKGNGITADSFDSADPAKSTNGRWDPAKAGDHGDVASNEGVVSSVSVANANIYGHTFTGPGGGVTVGSQGAVGSHTWQASNNGIQPGWVLDNANYTFPDTGAPYSNGTLPVGGDVVTIKYSTNSSYYTSSSYPSPPANGYVGPVTTNVTTITTSYYPSPPPAGLTTNTTYTTSSTWPNPPPSGITTNYNTTSETSMTYPAAGTYVGNVATNVVTNGKLSERGTYYIYDHITGIQSYTYPVITYRYPNYTYSYTIYQGDPSYVTNHYDHIIQSGDYYATSLSGSTIVLGDARLVLPNGLNMSSGDGITVAQGGKIKVYSGGTGNSIGGNGVVNATGFAGNFIVYCDLTVTSFAFNGNGEFTGILVAPNASITMNGGGNSRQDFTGALLVGSVTMNGHFNFHYDEALGRMPGDGRALITSWNEL